MDYMLANPTVPLWAVANHFERQQAWISTVINSDLFVAHMHERRKLIETAQRDALNAQLFDISARGLSKLYGALDDEEVSVAEKRAITRLGLDAQGFLTSAKSNAASVVINNSNSAQALSQSEDNKDRINQARQRILEQSRNAQLLLSPSDGADY
jgi:hypothetical protein